MTDRQIDIIIAMPRKERIEYTLEVFRSMPGPDSD
jgi:hypothetical protein